MAPSQVCRDRVFISYSKPRISSKILPVLRVVFSPLFLVLGYPDETLSLVFDILHTNQADATLKTDTPHNYAQRDRGR